MFSVVANFFKNKSKEESTICVCVLNSYSVTGAVVRVFNREGAISEPIVLFSYEEKTPVRHSLDTEAVELAVVAHAKKVLEKCRSFHGRFDKVTYVIGEPWVTTSVRSLHIERVKPFKVTQKMIDEAVARDIKLFESELEQDFSGDSIAIIETMSPTVDINGYRAGITEGVFAKTLDIHSTVSIASGIFIEELVAVFADVFHHDRVSFATMNTAQALLVSPVGKAVVLALGGTDSTVSLIDHGITKQVVTITNGLLRFEENIMNAFDVHQSQVMRAMRFANDEQFLKHHRDLYYQRINAAYEDLGNDISKGMLTLKKYTTIPEPLYVVGNPAWIPTLEGFINSDTGINIMIPSVTALDNRIIYSHTAQVRNVPLSLAVLRVVDSAL